MKVLYDYEIFFSQKYGGISRYFYEMYTRFLGPEFNMEVTIPIVFSQNYYLSNMVKIKKFLPHGNMLLNELVTIGSILWNRIKGKEYDVIHPTYYCPHFLEKKWVKKGKSKVIVTVYDMIHEMYMSEEYEFIEQKHKMLHLADGIIAISDCTKKDILKFCPDIREDKIKVIYLGNSMCTPGKNENYRIIKGKYILFVGERRGYKNFDIVLRALKLLIKKYPEMHLLCAGGGELRSEEYDRITKLNLQGKVIQVTLDDTELFWAYKNAECFVFPSLYEGFGIPILEAFFCECPVILSKRSCFPEIAEDAALYFDGYQDEDLYRKIDELLCRGNIRGIYVERGIKRLENFSWDKTAKQTKEFYEEIVKDG
ncbi:MAG: glycosyltransferase family 4 protein [Enterocloster sp.]